MARLNSIFVLFSLAVNHKWSMFQLDVKNPSCTVTLRRRSMEQPPDMLFRGENIVSKPKKAIHGLK